jgi:hypothetical protein
VDTYRFNGINFIDLMNHYADRIMIFFEINFNVGDSFITIRADNSHVLDTMVQNNHNIIQAIFATIPQTPDF